MTVRRRPVNFIDICLLSFCMMASFAFAADEKPPPVEAAAQIEKMERMGLYIKTADGSLGPDLWKGAKRSDITKQLQEMPASSPEVPVQKFIHGILLTQTESNPVGDLPLEPGMDLFTLRLDKLLQAGLYDEAAVLYSKLEEDPYHEKLAYAGVVTLLLDGDKSLACIEAHAAKQSFPQSNLTQSIVEYCDQTQGPASPVAYDLEIFSGFSLEKLAMLTADDVIDASQLSKENIEKIPIQHIPLLLKTKTLSEENRFLLNLQAAHWGLISTEDLQDYYITIANQVAADENASPPEYWKKIAWVYAEVLKTEDAAQRWTLIRGILPNTISYGEETLLPFGEAIYDIETQDINYSELQTIFPVLIRHNGKIPRHWIEIADELIKTQEENTPESLTNSGLYAAVFLSKLPSDRTSKDRDRIFGALKLLKIKDNYFVNYIIENIDKSLIKDNNDRRVYEKDYRLTFEEDYVMPSQYVWHRIQDISQESSIGETVLLSTLALGEKTLPEIHPDVFISVLEALEKVGLTDTSERLALAAFIGSTT